MRQKAIASIEGGPTKQIVDADRKLTSWGSILDRRQQADIRIKPLGFQEVTRPV